MFGRELKFLGSTSSVLLQVPTEYSGEEVVMIGEQELSGSSGNAHVEVRHHVDINDGIIAQRHVSTGISGLTALPSNFVLGANDTAISWGQTASRPPAWLLNHTLGAMTHVSATVTERMDVACLLTFDYREKMDAFFTSQIASRVTPISTNQGRSLSKVAKQTRGVFAVWFYLVVLFCRGVVGLGHSDGGGARPGGPGGTGT